MRHALITFAALAFSTTASLSEKYHLAVSAVPDDGALFVLTTESGAVSKSGCNLISFATGPLDVSFEKTTNKKCVLETTALGDLTKSKEAFHSVLLTSDKALFISTEAQPSLARCNEAIKDYSSSKGSARSRFAQEAQSNKANKVICVSSELPLSEVILTITK